MADPETTSLGELLANSPSNWRRWGPNDQVGALNFLNSAEALRGIRSVRSGKTFTLQVPMGLPAGDPAWPGRSPVARVTTMDESSWDADDAPAFPGGLHYADDRMTCELQGSTQYDAIGHPWYDGQIYNGYDARDATVGSMSQASVFSIAEKGVVGRGVLVDIARLRGKRRLDVGETFNHHDILAAARAQDVTIEKHDIVVIHTGSLGRFYEEGAEAFYADFREPGLVYSTGLVEWFHNMEVPNLVTDTITNEVAIDPHNGAALVLHGALIRNLGVAFTEIASLDALASDCADDKQYSFLYVAAPLKIVGAAGAPVNPVVVK